MSKLTDHCLDLLMMKASRTFRVVTTRCDNIKNMYDNKDLINYKYYTGIYIVYIFKRLGDRRYIKKEMRI